VETTFSPHDELEKQMRYGINQHPGDSVKIRLVLAAALLMLALALSIGHPAAAQKFTAPLTPASITPPAGNDVFMAGHAIGTQGYMCLPEGTGFSWTVNGSRPQATLFGSADRNSVQSMTHFMSPDTNPNEFAPKPLPFGSATWQSSLDSSRVWAQPLHAIPAGSHASCTNLGAISCLLLQSVGSENGTTGGKILSGTTFIQRLNTQGGSAPTSGCSAARDVGKQVLVPYSADYYFFRADH
jgi:hypothetical protein